jgi:hypothetical protein
MMADGMMGRETETVIWREMVHGMMGRQMMRCRGRRGRGLRGRDLLRDGVPGEAQRNRCRGGKCPNHWRLSLS